MATPCSCHCRMVGSVRPRPEARGVGGPGNACSRQGRRLYRSAKYLGKAAFATISTRRVLVKRGEGQQQRDRHTQQAKNRRSLGPFYSRQARDGSGSAGQFITYYMETIFRAEPWWRARSRDGALAGPGPWGPRSVFTLGMHVDISHLHARMSCTLTYCVRTYVCGWGRETNQVLEEEGQKQDGAGLGWQAGGHTHSPCVDRTSLCVQSDRCA